MPTVTGSTRKQAGLYYDAGGGVVNIMHPNYGAVLDGVTLNDNAWALAVADAQAKGHKLFIPPGILQLSASALWPAGLDIDGAGKDRTIIRVAGAVNGFNAADAGPGYALSGKLHGFTLQGTGGALRGIDVNFRDMPILDHVKVTGFLQQGLYYKNCLLSEVNHCLFQNNGGNGFHQVEVELGTTFFWNHCYISGSPAGTLGGLAIDKMPGFTIVGGAIESTGIPIRLGSKADAVIGTNNGVILGIDMENPSNNAALVAVGSAADCFIEMGLGWSGAANQGVTRVSIQGIQSSPSGSVTVKYGVRAQNTDTIYSATNKWGVPSAASGGVSAIELVGLTNIRWSTGIHGSSIGVNLSFVRENGVTRPDAQPYSSWEQQGKAGLIGLHSAPLTQNSATPDASGMLNAYTANTGLTTLNTMSGGRDGQLLILNIGDNFTTIKHNFGGALTNSFWLFDQVDYKTRASDMLFFVFESASGYWKQVGHNVAVIGITAGNYANVSSVSGQFTIAIQGVDATVSFNINPKGAGFVKANITSQFAALRVGAVAGGNWMDIFPNVTGSPPRMKADGADVNIDLNLEPKGTGVAHVIAAPMKVDLGFGCNTKAAQGAFASGGAAPAGGVGTAAGGYDTAANRDAAITLLNNIRAALVANGIMS